LAVNLRIAGGKGLPSLQRTRILTNPTDSNKAAGLRSSKNSAIFKVANLKELVKGLLRMGKKYHAGKSAIKGTDLAIPPYMGVNIKNWSYVP
jgi:hypothetical protein